MEIPKSLIELGKEMNKQDNRCTRLPLFVVQDTEKRSCGEWEDADGFNCGEEWDDDFKEDLCCSGDCQKYIDKCEDEKDCPDFEKLCLDCKRENGFAYKETTKFDLRYGVWLTAKACDNHIKANNYHYHNPRSYCISAGRAYETQELLCFLSSLDPEGRNTNSYPE